MYDLFEKLDSLTAYYNAEREFQDDIVKWNCFLHNSDHAPMASEKRVPGFPDGIGNPGTSFSLAIGCKPTIRYE
jgi:hypothetical protein